MNVVLKVLIVVLVILYFVSPVDVAPGLIDDIIVVLMGLAAQKGLSARED